MTNFKKDVLVELKEMKRLGIGSNVSKTIRLVEQDKFNEEFDEYEDSGMNQSEFVDMLLMLSKCYKTA